MFIIDQPPNGPGKNAGVLFDFNVYLPKTPEYCSKISRPLSVPPKSVGVLLFFNVQLFRYFLNFMRPRKIAGSVVQKQPPNSTQWDQFAPFCTQCHQFEPTQIVGVLFKINVWGNAATMICVNGSQIHKLHIDSIQIYKFWVPWSPIFFNWNPRCIWILLVDGVKHIIVSHIRKVC